MNKIFKKIVTKQIHKHLKHHTNIPNYLFWRWLVGKVNDRNVETDTIIRLGSAFAKTYPKLSPSHLTDVFFFDKTLYIVTPRPGLLIGKHGSSIDNLINLIGCPVALIENHKDNLMTFLDAHYYVSFEEL